MTAANGLPKGHAPEIPSPLHAYLRVLRARWRLVVLVFMVTVGSAMLFTSWQTPIYQAAATVLIEPEPPRVVNIQDVNSDATASQEYYATQYKVIESRPVVDAVVQRLKLKERIPAIGGASDPYLAFVRDLTIAPIKNTRLVLVKYEHPEPAMAMELANAVANQYVKYTLDVKQSDAQTATVWLNEQIQQLRSKAQQSSQALQAYQAKADLLGLQDQRQITQQKLMDFNRAYLEAQNLRLAAEAKQRELSRLAKDPTGADTALSVVNDPLIHKLKAEASDLQIERSKLSQIYREKHPDLQQLDAQIRQVNERLQSELQKMLRAVESEVKVARGREDTLLANMNDLRREARTLNEREAQATSLQREKDSAEELQGTVLKRLKETGLTSALTTTNIRVVEAATVPTFPIRPRTQLIWTLSAIVGLVLGAGLAFLTDSLDNRARTADDIERVLGVPIVGMVPVFSTKRHE
jgi:polysaccharide biosynthesis transport protein